MFSTSSANKPSSGSPHRRRHRSVHTRSVSRKALFLCLTVVTQASAARVARAQGASFWLDAGGAVVRQPLGTSRSAATVGLGADLRGRRTSLTGDGAVSMAGDTISASQLVLRSQFAWSAWTVSEVEGSATASGITIPGSDGNRSALFRQYVRLGEFRLGALDFDAVRLFGGAGAGRTSRYSLDSRGTAQHLGLSSTHGPLSFTVTVQRATSDDWQLFEPTGIGLKRPAASYELRDVTTELSWQRGRVALSTTGSWRAGVGATSGKGQVLATAVSWNAVGPLTLIAQAGEQLADPLRGIPQATYAGLSVRVQRSRGNAPGLRDALRRDALGRASRASETTAFDALRDAEYQLERSGNGATLVLRVAAASDAVVEMACSATEWRTVRMTREGAEWIARLPLASGTHRVALRVNGGDWRAPRGLSRVSDDFGGSVGLLVVP